MSDWVVEAALQFVRQPLWTTPVQNFIDSNCACFDSEEELKLEYTIIHKKFQDLIEGILESMLDELGVGPEALVEACEASKESDPNIRKFLQYLYSLDDFRSFRAIMVKRNVELEAEAMKEWSKMHANHTAKQQQGEEAEGKTLTDSQKPESAEDDEDAQQLELALQASIQNDELIMKDAEVEDAELQAALALSMAEEQERMRKEEELARTSADKDKQDADDKASKEISDADAAQVEKQKAEEGHKKAQEEISRKRKEAEAAMQAREAEVLKERTEKLAVAVAAAEKSREEEKAKNPDAPAVLRTSLTQLSSEAKPALPGLGEIQKRGGGGGFGKFGALPTLGDGQPSFSTLKQQVVPSIKKEDPKKDQQSAEDKAEADKKAQAEMAARSKYMAEQRRKLIEAKKQERDGDLKSFAEANKLSNNASPPAATTQAESKGSEVSKEDKEHNDMSRALMRRFKDDLIQESSKPL